MPEELEETFRGTADVFAEMFHVTASLNRDSIDRHGLDWRLMGAARGIADGTPPGYAGRPPSPEAECVFLCAGDGDVSFFCDMARHPCDVWAVDVKGLPVEDGPDGWWLVREPVDRARLRLVQRDIPPGDPYT
ncbi:MAG TPA: hypothetical protein VFR41_01895 [Acidimicrobiia bacterium]|nr:hypothetical protein [Acidimicrobiia bacterium]